MTSLKKKADAEDSASFMGIRRSIWEVVVVMACGGIGAMVGRSIYSSEAVYGAFFGVLLGPGMLSWLLRRKPSVR